MKIPLPVLFALGTALCWGCYGPTLGFARSPEKLYSPFKPYIGIGLAYFVASLISDTPPRMVRRNGAKSVAR